MKALQRMTNVSIVSIGTKHMGCRHADIFPHAFRRVSLIYDFIVKFLSNKTPRVESVYDVEDIVKSFKTTDIM